MRVMSVYDLKLVPQLAHLSPLDFVNPENYKLLIPFLKTLGYDVSKPVQFLPCQHRTLAGKVVIGYLVVGDISQEREFLLSGFCTAEDRIIAAGAKDLSLAYDMAKSMTACRDYGADSVEGFPPDQANPDEEQILNEIKLLQTIADIAQGNLFKSDGSRKTLQEF